MLSSECVRSVCDAYYEDIFRFCLSRVREPDAAFDLTQEVFLLLQEKRQQLNEENLKAWLLKTADNKIKAQFRVVRGRLLTEISYEDAENELIAQTELLLRANEPDDEELAALQNQALAKLNAADRELYRLRYQHKWKYAQIAELYDSREQTVQVRTFRLRAKLRKIVRELLDKREGNT